MSLFGEWKEEKQYWKKANSFQRFVIIVSLFLTVSSITSLSDVVFQWKGFILDGIVFYRLWIGYPLQSLVSWFGLQLSSSEIDTIILFSLYIGSQFRLGYYTGSILITTIAAIIITASWIGLHKLLQVTGEQNNYFLYMVFGAMASRVYWLISNRSKADRKEQLIFFGPIILAVIVTLVLGAINSGLSRH